MTRSFLQHPTGLVGWALLLLRLSVAVGLSAGAGLVGVPWAEPLVIVIAAMLAVGALTRIAALCGLAAGVLIGVKTGGPLGYLAALQGLTSLALSMIGPGGYSIDARLFGRRVINLDLEPPA